MKPYYYKRPSMYTLCSLLNTNDRDTLYKLAKYANDAFLLRKSLL